MKVIATEVKCKELKEGDLFSTASQLYWDNAPNNLSVGEKVYVRTAQTCPDDQAEETIYRITIEK